jgi:hypothetical protein
MSNEFFKGVKQWEFNLGELPFKMPVIRGKNSKIITYSNIEDIPLVTNIYFNQLEFAESRDKQAATLEIGSDHRICEELQKIGLSATPVQYQYSPLNQAILFAGRNLMDD